ncbi:MAG: Carboxyl-terminal processing protease [Verrucomicrobia bacterium]|nr:Carboxyl-terminal processing protease [Verrucomicrobiota bacterium]
MIHRFSPAARWALVLLVSILTVRATEPEKEKIPEADWPDVRERTFTEVWQTVNDTYCDPTFGGVDWAAMRVKYHAKLADSTDKAKLRDLLQSMLNELRRTHFAILPREAAVFTPAERTRIGTVGATFARVEGQIVVAKVHPGSPADLAGITPGQVVLGVNGFTMAQLGSWLTQAGMSESRSSFYLANYVTGWLRRPVGTEVQLALADAAGGAKEVKLTCAPHDGAWSEPLGNFPSLPLEMTTTRAPDGLAYLSFNLFTPSLMKGVRTFLRSLQPGDGLVIDLRGNGGGVTVMAPGISGWLTTKEFSLGGMSLRQGFMSFAVFPQEKAFTGPVAILIDSGSASTSEILAAGLQEEGRARIFGERSAGAALPSSFKTLPMGDLFQFAIADMKTPKGKVLEGEGVAPDQDVQRTRAGLAAGEDPVLSAANSWLDRERHAAPANAAGAGTPKIPAESKPR